MTNKKYQKVRNHCHRAGEYRGTVHNIFNLKNGVPKKIRAAFHNGSNYDYNFIIKELADEVRKQFIWLGENIENYATFTVPIKKVNMIIDKNGERITKIVSYILQFIDRVRFMASS